MKWKEDTRGEKELAEKREGIIKKKTFQGVGTGIEAGVAGRLVSWLVRAFLSPSCRHPRIGLG